MDVTPQLLKDVEFREKFRGYDPDEVDDFLERIAVSYGRLQEQLRQADDRSEEAAARAARAEQHATAGIDNDETLKRTLVLAQRTADAAIQEANENAAAIVANADKEANARLSRIDEEAAQHRAEAERTTQQRIAELDRDATVSRDQLSAEAARLREDADTYSAKQRQEADGYSGTQRQEADGYSAKLRADTDNEATQRIEMATRDAEQMGITARSESERVAAEAQAQAAQAVQNAETDAVRQTRDEHERLTGDIAHLRQRRELLAIDVTALDEHATGHRAKLEAISTNIRTTLDREQPSAVPVLRTPLCSEPPSRFSDPSDAPFPPLAASTFRRSSPSLESNSSEASSAANPSVWLAQRAKPQVSPIRDGGAITLSLWTSRPNC